MTIWNQWINNKPSTENSDDNFEDVKLQVDLSVKKGDREGFQSGLKQLIASAKGDIRVLRLCLKELNDSGVKTPINCNPEDYLNPLILKTMVNCVKEEAFQQYCRMEATVNQL